jgi:hypothetical protein
LPAEWLAARRSYILKGSDDFVNTLFPVSTTFALVSFEVLGEGRAL